MLALDWECACYGAEVHKNQTTPLKMGFRKEKGSISEGSFLPNFPVVSVLNAISLIWQ